MISRLLRRMVLGCLLLTTASAFGQTPFFQGKTIRFVVGYQSGDSHDLWARAYARHMGKHIPGNPTFIVQNMTGAGSMIAANHIYNVAKPDGLTMGTFAPGLYLAQLTGNQEVKFDWAKYSWIGSPEQDGNVLFMRADAPYKTIEDIRKAAEPPKCSATGVGTSWRMLLQAQRSCGNWRNDPSANAIATSGRGGNPVIHSSFCGSLSAAFKEDVMRAAVLSGTYGGHYIHVPRGRRDSVLAPSRAGTG